MTDEELRALARKGVEVEIARLMKVMEELGGVDTTSQRLDGAPPKRRRAEMTAAQRKAVSKRMRAMWAAKRAAKK